MPKSQSYANHKRRFPIFHYVTMPILVANLVIVVAHAIRQPSPFNAWLVVLSIGLVCGMLANRASALLVQNRVIGLEMRLRLATSLPAELRSRIHELALRQLIGLRFAGDGELPGLVERCLKGELPTTDSVKRAVTEWRPDFVRA